MILLDDGLDRLWEDGVNWNRLDPRRGGKHGEEESEKGEQEEEEYVPIVSNSKEVDTSVMVEDILPQSYMCEYDDEKRKHESLKRLMAKQLWYQYQRNELRWPKYRKDIEDKYNQTVRREYPGAGDA